MSRTKRALPHDVVRSTKTREDYIKEWSDVYRGSHYAHRSYRWNERLGRDGGYHSGVYAPYTHAPNFIDRWREDATHAPRKKAHLKRELAQLHRRYGKAQIAQILYDMEDWV